MLSYILKLFLFSIPIYLLKAYMFELFSSSISILGRLFCVFPKIFHVFLLLPVAFAWRFYFFFCLLCYISFLFFLQYYLVLFLFKKLKRTYYLIRYVCSFILKTSCASSASRRTTSSREATSSGKTSAMIMIISKASSYAGNI